MPDRADIPIAFKRLVVLSNPRSSNAERAKQIITDLEKAYPGKVVKGTVAKTEAANIKTLKEILRPGDILLVCGGDGTIGNMIQNLLDPSIPKALRQTPVLPVGTGRMCDLARMANGRHFRNPLYVLRHAKKLAVDPIACVCTPLSTSRPALKKLSVYNIGFGYSGQCSIAWNDPDFRAELKNVTPVRRTYKFFKTASSLLKDAEYFEITADGKRRKVLEVTAAVGHIFGGYYRLPVRLSQRKFLYIISDDKSFLGTVRSVAELMTNRYNSGKLTTSEEFVLHDPVVAHVGGEIFDPPVPCKVRITHHSEPVIMLATSPKA